ncbi:MAG: CBS domain-containing protein [Rhodospirillaceae bacterium]|jgi:predicted transcriptional regulator|nr:CBS domain-containing protein [Rhodospirillaceae bacterium]MBT3886890.1 CBS domain-containing protein [Rhodospirillaceae bacterium]MBT4116066.1 CBS domain-containing protein [Rhodospirillaceae bacterium]MBT4673819.1 CBS domain-containing protein [Rhodospirillaceae bacterium]MBT4721385.1 CBS domain-containing protein [Rhodospirillaceae bacterium]
MNDIPYTKVADVMTASVHTIDHHATITDAIEMIRETRVSSLIVEPRDDADEFGLLGVTDIAREVIGKGRAPDRVNVYEVVTKPVLTLPREMNIKYAVRLLVNFKLSRALVVDANRKSCGIVTIRDMVLGL